MWTQHPLETEAIRASRKKVKIVGYLDLLLTICLVIFLVMTTVLPLALINLSAKEEWEEEVEVVVLEEQRLPLYLVATTQVVTTTAGPFMEDNPLNSVHFWTGILLGIVVTFGLVGILAAVTLIKAVHYSSSNPDEAGLMTRFWMHCNNAIIFTLVLWLPFSFVLYDHHDGPCPVPYLLYLLVRLIFTVVIWRNRRYTSPELHYNLAARKDIERQLYKPPTPRRRARFESYAMRYQFYGPALQLKPYQGGGNGFIPQCHCVRPMGGD